MHYMLLPLAEHYDDGFGAVADSFRESAEWLLEDPPETRSFTEHLPIAYLYRHAIELYLKSGIVIFHRRFDIPYGEHPASGEPWALVDGTWKLLRNIHSLVDLHAHLHALFDDCLDTLRETTRTRWEIPDDVGESMRVIDSLDSSSTFFRYPTTRHEDAHIAKEVVQEVDVIDVWDDLEPGDRGVSRVMVYQRDGDTPRVFQREEDAALAMLDLLRATAQFTHDFHAATRGELTGGG